MNYKKILKVVVAVAVAAVFSVGCSETPPDDDGGGYTGSYGSVTHGGKTYKTVKIGIQTWFAENLDYAVGSSVCYDNSSSNCAKYGRLYNWDDANDACPSGWHLPNDAEWARLTVFVGGESTAGTKLKATSGWNNNGNGTDQYGFSALPGGNGYGGNFYDVGQNGYWWSATVDVDYYAWFWSMDYRNENVGRYHNKEPNLFSVRCVQD